MTCDSAASQVEVGTGDPRVPAVYNGVPRYVSRFGRLPAFKIWLPRPKSVNERTLAYAKRCKGQRKMRMWKMTHPDHHYAYIFARAFRL